MLNTNIEPSRHCTIGAEINVYDSNVHSFLTQASPTLSCDLHSTSLLTLY